MQYGHPLRRFTDHKPAGNPMVLAADHPAVRDGRTLFPGRVARAVDAPRLLKSGQHSRKIGDRVVKGRWRGMPIYTLTLEERATCPASCRHWRDCYGNKMNWAPRLRPGPDLERRLRAELAGLQRQHPRGFVVRLHVLGDFYSADYVQLWFDWLHAFPALRVFGYTAHPAHGEIGHLIRWASSRFWDRFAVRTSDGGAAERCTVSHDGPAASAPGIVCPAQTGRTQCCGTCGLCWGTRRNITFLVH